MKYEESNYNPYNHKHESVEYADQSIETLLSDIQNTIDEKESVKDDFVTEAKYSDEQQAFGASFETAQELKPKRKKAQIKIESVLNLRTFFLVAGFTVYLGLYIYNVISINRLAGESEMLRQRLVDQESVNVVLQSKLQHAQRIEKISEIAQQRLGLKAKAELPELIEMN